MLVNQNNIANNFLKVIVLTAAQDQPSIILYKTASCLLMK
jgi:hypothetical protein